MKHSSPQCGFLRRGLLLAAAGLLGGLALGLPVALAARQDPPKPAEKSAPSKDLRVLFVGNSYCYVNTLPEMLVELAKSRPGGVQISVESVTPGGATMKQHFESTGAFEKIRAGGFTHVVLQGQSLEPVAQPDEFQEFAGKLALQAKQAGAKVVFYQTWARREGSKEYGESWSGGTPKKLQEGLSQAYAKAAKLSGGSVARVGDAWRALLDGKEPLQLFAEDGSHPALPGTYLAACVFYETLTGASCLELDGRREGLGAKDALRLRKTAHALAAK